MSNYVGIVEAVSAAIGAGAVVGETSRRYWQRREARQRAAFERSVREIIAAYVADIIKRQADFEQRTGAHLDRQDKILVRLEQQLKSR